MDLTQPGSFAIFAPAFSSALVGVILAPPRNDMSVHMLVANNLDLQSAQKSAKYSEMERRTNIGSIPLGIQKCAPYLI